MGGPLSTSLQEVMNSSTDHKDAGDGAPKIEIQSESIKTEKDEEKITEIPADIDDEL